ncbi:hypothetical protein HDU67_009568 [Dinochytrium kinnereticum]|nr:hypothetical protein HDU67_009568 [Dinochytrium kinnereticum]
MSSSSSSSMEDISSDLLEITNLSPATSLGDITALVEERLIPQSEEQRGALAASQELLDFLAKVLTESASNIENGKDVAQSMASGTAIARLIAEACKSEQPRTAFGEAHLISPLVRHLIQSTRHLQDGSKGTTQDERLTVQVLRALANLCYENETNRDYLFEVPQSVAAVAICLKSTETSILHTVCGGLLNISMDNEPIQIEVVASHGLNYMLDIITKGTEGPTASKYKPFVPPCIRTLSNVLEIDQGIQELISCKGLVQLLTSMKVEHQVLLNEGSDDQQVLLSLEILEALTAALETIGENDDIQRSIAQLELLEILLDFVDHPPRVPLPQSTEDEEVPNYHEIRKQVSKIVTLVTMNDANMAEIPQIPSVIERFKRWMTLGFEAMTEVEEDEIRMSGALCIGNLARSDETCTLLVNEYGVGKALLELLLLEKNRLQISGIKEETKSSLKVLHAVVGALKNLSIATGDRRTLGEIGIIQPVSELLEMDGLKPVQFSCIGVLKNLCGGSNELNAYRIITGIEPPHEEDRVVQLRHDISPTERTPLNKIISLVWKATGDNLAGIRNEGARTIVNLVRTCHIAGAPHLIKHIVDANGIVPLIQIVTGALLTKPRATNSDDLQTSPTTEHHVHFDALPSEGQVYSLVQNEGLVALILICNACPEAIPQVTRYHSSLIPTAISILRSNVPGAEDDTAQDESNNVFDKKLEYSDAVKVNVCLLLGALVTVDSSFREKVKSALQPILNPLLKWTSESNLEASSAASAAANASIVASIPASPPPTALSRTQTKSARNLPSGGYFGGRDSTSAYTSSMGGRPGTGTVEIAPGGMVALGRRAGDPRSAAEEGLVLVEALRRLVGVL